MVYDVIVVGAGVMGCATAYTLGKQGKKTLLIEQFPLPHTRGSSHGASRITRMAYLESFNANIMKEAFPMWRTLEQESGMELFREAGMLLVTADDFESLSKYHLHIQKHSSKEVELLDQKKLTENYPLMSFKDPKYVGCLDESAGTLFADKCLQAFQRVFLENGGTIMDNCKVKSLTPELCAHENWWDLYPVQGLRHPLTWSVDIPGEEITIDTDKGSYKSKGVVLTCGAWAAKTLVPLGITLPLEPQTIQVCYWKSMDGADHRKVPIFSNLTKDLDYEIYGLPTMEYDGLVKIDLHHGVQCDPDCRDLVDIESEAKDLKILKEMVAQSFPYLHAEPAIKERCMYTMTPDDNCIIDCHPIHKNIVYAAGFSGQGFKQAPVIGKILSELVDGRESELLVDEMRAKRFIDQTDLTEG